jgi:predicted O-methyltransferase YrrM
MPLKQRIASVLDIVLLPLVLTAAVLLKWLRRIGFARFPRCREMLLKRGVFPIAKHYYEPLFTAADLRYPLAEPRDLPGIDWNVEEQLGILEAFAFNDELRDIPSKPGAELAFHFGNENFGSGDAEYLYNIIRLKKPGRILEVGSGYSTLMAMRALRKNREENPAHTCRHTCIEPYEMPWLEQTGVSVVRKKVEETSLDLFLELAENDLLFIDSSHVIRPQGDVLFLYLQVLPRLRPGVIVHIHDIFTPRDYLESWVLEEVRFWNEQYLLEAMLTGSADWKIIGALNYLHHRHYKALARACPYLSPSREPGSIYIQKVSKPR